MTPECVAQYRDLLRLLAGMLIRPHMRGRIDPSSVVHQTLFEAIRDLPDFKGPPEKFVAWLRMILTRNILDAARKKQPASLEDVKKSSKKLEHSIASPSEKALSHERLMRLSAALAQLPQDQRTAVEYKHLQGWRVADIARHMNKSTQAVTGLLRRGLHTMRGLLKDLKD